MPPRKRPLTAHRRRRGAPPRPAPAACQPSAGVRGGERAAPGILPGGPGTPAAPVLAVCLICLSFAVLPLLAGCGTTAPATSPVSAGADSAAAVPKPAMSMKVASLDLSDFRGRIEAKQVDELARLISTLRIDIIALQGITRYPGVSTRTDPVDALAAATGMRASFGETISVSGRQSGNAVLSAYPIESSDNRPYDGISGNGFEGALVSLVDAGTRTVLIVSTRLPRPLSRADGRLCAGTLNSIAAEYPNDPLIVLGNLPGSPAGDTWRSAGADPAGGTFSWFTPRGLTLRGGDGARCGLGDLRVAEVDLYPHGRP